SLSSVTSYMGLGSTTYPCILIILCASGKKRGYLGHMARRYCPVCRKSVDEVVQREGNLVVKKCPNCGYVFAKYELKGAAAK
ncbi:MAG: hypothetical protein ACP5KY_09950, partial [Thermoproteus sp.]